MKIYEELEQGSDEWLAARRGILTASEAKLIVTPKFSVANNDKKRAHAYELAAQRVTGRTEPQYISDDMLRGMFDEATARDIYAEHYEPVTEVGFITNEIEGAMVGYSPDGLAGDDGLIEIKSRRQKFQMQYISEMVAPPEHLVQMHFGMLVSGRKWCDYVQYCAGMPLFVKRVYRDEEIIKKLTDAVLVFEESINEILFKYRAHAAALVKTEIKEDENGVSLI